MGITESDGRPAWLQEVDSSLVSSAQIDLYGNVKDEFLLEGTKPGADRSLADALWQVLEKRSYETLFIYDPVTGFGVHAARGGLDNGREVGASLGIPFGEPWLAAGALATAIRSVAMGRRSGSPRAQVLSEAADTAVEGTDPTQGGIRRAAPASGSAGSGPVRVAVAIDYASRLFRDMDRLADHEHHFMTEMLHLSHSAVPLRPQDIKGVPLFNPVFWITGNERDLPDWLVTGNHSIRTIAVPYPDMHYRQRHAKDVAGGFDDYKAADEADRQDMVERFAAQSHGMTINDMEAIRRLARDRGVGMSEIEDAARAHRVGVLDTPWPRLRPKVLAEVDGNQGGLLNRRVRGQQAAVNKALDIIIRSATGLTAAHSSPYATAPRGVLFFAGPTGVGKTELAKALTELVFGDENAYKRFDMSEFSADHNVARLIGAPPGYVGFDAGGELTDFVRERPFSLILFDEIEKAHGRILDKFLQILEDGRLTDGRGQTVYFTETVLVFTSNLGTTRVKRGPDGHPIMGANGLPVRESTVEYGMDPGDLGSAIRAGIEDWAVNELGRPEILNRLGDGIVVFDFITREVGMEILDGMVERVCDRLKRENDCTLEISELAKVSLEKLCLTERVLSNGGRGIGTQLTKYLVDPLARAVFFEPEAEGRTCRVTSFGEEDEAGRLLIGAEFT